MHRQTWPIQRVIPLWNTSSESMPAIGATMLTLERCHAGELMYLWGTIGQLQLPFRDANDLPFSQFVMDAFASFIRSQNPNPDRALLNVRGYKTSLQMFERAGFWEPVVASKPQLRIMDIPTKTVGFQEADQCDFLGLPLNFFESA